MRKFFLPIIFIISALISNQLLATNAKVIQVNPKKKYVIINAGSNNGLAKGSKVCFYLKKKKITCATANRVKADKSIVPVKKRLKFIKKGTLARFKGGATSSVGKASKDIAEPTAQQTQHFMAIRPLWLPYFLSFTAADYNLMTYNGAAAQQGESLWTSTQTYTGGPNSMILASFGLEAELFSLGLLAGFHYKAYASYAAESDFEPSVGAHYIHTQSDASAVGFYIDYMFSLGESFSIGVGIDFDMLTLTYIGTSKWDTAIADQDPNFAETEIYNISASGNILSLHLPIRYYLYFGAIGLSAGVNIMLPLTALGVAVTANSNDTLNGTKNEDPLADITTALGLKNSSFAFETVLGLSYRF